MFFFSRSLSSYFKTRIILPGVFSQIILNLGKRGLLVLSNGENGNGEPLAQPKYVETLYAPEYQQI